MLRKRMFRWFFCYNKKNAIFVAALLAGGLLFSCDQAKHFDKLSDQRLAERLPYKLLGTGSYTAETFKETTTGKTRAGMSVHAGREYKPIEDRLTEGCVRTTPEGMTGIDNAIKNYGPLQSIIIQNNRESANSSSANSVNPGGSDHSYHLKEVTVTAKKRR